MLSVKQGGMKYDFLSLWYDSTWDWTPVSRTIGEHSTHKANDPNIAILEAILMYAGKWMVINRNTRNHVQKIYQIHLKSC